MKKKKAALIRNEWPRIRLTKNGYEIDARKTGTNGRQHYRKTQEEAEKLAAQLAADLKTQGTEGFDMPADLRLFALKGAEILKPYGKSILQAVDHYKAYLDSLATETNSRLIKDLTAEWYNDKQAGAFKTLRGDSLLGIKKGQNFLDKHFGDKRVMAVKPTDFKALFASLDLTKQTKDNMRNLSSQFFNWCIEHNYATANPADKKLIRFKVEPKDLVVILTPEKATDFMRLCEKKYPQLMAYHALCLFAGLRPFEAYRMKWEWIDFENRTIYVPAAISKTKEDRQLHMEDNLHAWLMTVEEAKRKGHIAKQKNHQNILKKYRKDLGYAILGANKGAEEYPQDATRHSYASYFLKIYTNRNQLAENMGNSLDMIRKHYKRLVSAKAAQEYWEILPEEAAKALAAKKAEEAAKKKAQETEEAEMFGAEALPADKAEPNLFDDSESVAAL